MNVAVAAATAAPYAYVDATPLLQALDAEADAVLNAAESVLRGTGVGSKRTKLDGAAGQAILAFARQTNPDVIVMGTHGRAGIPRFILRERCRGRAALERASRVHRQTPPNLI